MAEWGKLIVLSGPSGCGKNTLINELLRLSPDTAYSISVTTRKPRDGEKDGQHYFFVSVDAFTKMRENNELLEWAQVYDHYYGTPRNYIIDILSKGKNLVLDVDIQGAQQIKRNYPEGIFVFLLPPSLKVLEERILGRGKDSPEVVAKRLACAKDEINQIYGYDYYIINNDLVQATNNLLAIICAEKCKVENDKVDDVIEKIITSQGISRINCGGEA